MTRIPDLALPVMAAIALPGLAYLAMGTMPFAVFTLAFGGGLVFYLLTLWRRPIDTPRLLVPYLLTVMLFILHVWEEYMTDFELVVSQISGRPVPEANFMTIAAFLAPMMWVGGAILILKRWRFGDYFLCTFFFAMMIAELTHYIFPVLIDGSLHYESGMYTAALPLIPAVYGIWLMFREMAAAPLATHG